MTTNVSPMTPADDECALTPDEAKLLVHELRSPLTAIVGYAELLRRPDILPADREKALAAIQDAVHRMDVLLDAAARGETLARADLSDLERLHLRQLADRAAADAHAAHWREVFVSGTDDPVVLGDKFMLRRLLDNLIANAIRYSPGAVRVKVREEEGRGIVEVIDHGPGIPIEERQRIFERFYRLGRDAEKPGTGVGLSVVREIVDTFGGSVWVEETLGGGSTFVVGFPLAD